MRNLLVYPITAEEVLQHLSAIIEDEREMQEAVMQIGSTRILSLELLMGFIRLDFHVLEDYLREKQLTT